jgi:hypothetical protein
MNFLIPEEQLRTAHARYLASEAAKKEVATPAPGFVYKPRTEQQWNRRAHQSYKSNFAPAAEPVTRTIEEPKHGAGDAPKAAKSKAVTGSSECECGHRHDLHNLRLPTPPLKPVPAIGDYSAIMTPCEARVWDGQAWKPCGCLNYCDAISKKPAALKRPKAEDWTLCARCGERKDHHCVKGRPGFRIGNTPYICSHFDQTLSPASFVCTDGHCAAVDEAGNFVDCKRFVNPFLTPRAKKVAPANSATAPRRSRKKKAAFTTGTLFPLTTEARDVRT